MKKAGFLFVALISFALMHSNGLFSQPCDFTLYNNTSCDFDYDVAFDGIRPYPGGCGSQSCIVTSTVTASSTACIHIPNPACNVDVWLIRVKYHSPSVSGGSINCPTSIPTTVNLANTCTGPNGTRLRLQTYTDAYIEDF